MRNNKEREEGRGGGGVLVVSLSAAFVYKKGKSIPISSVTEKKERFTKTYKDESLKLTMAIYSLKVSIGTALVLSYE